GGGLVTTSAGALQITNGIVTTTGPITLGSDAVIGVDTIRILNVNTNPVTLNGHTLTINGGASATVNLNTPLVDGVGGSGSLVVNDALAAATVVLTAANAFTGSTSVRGGTLTLSGAGTLASGNFTVAQGATLNLNNTNLAITPNRIPDGAAINL